MFCCPLCQTSETRLLLQDQVAGQERRDWSCSECGLVFLEPALRLISSEEKKRYDSHRNDPQDTGYLDFLRRLGTPLGKHLKAGDHGLDFGCGPGPAMAAVLKPFDVHLALYDPYYDPDKSLLERTYDFITVTEVVEHLYDPAREWGLLDSLLRPQGGVLGIMTEMLQPETDFASWWYRKDPTHVCFYRKETFRWIAEKFGFECEFAARNVVLLLKKKTV